MSSKMIYRIRHDLLWFITTLENYLFYSALAPCSLELRTSLLAAPNMDSLIFAHARFISLLENRCFLGPATANIHGAVVSLLELVVVFTGVVERQTAKASAPRTNTWQDKSQIALETNNSNVSEHDTESKPAIAAVENGTTIAARLFQMQMQYSTLLGFAISGLRTALRTTGADTAWETLVSLLDWNGAI